MKVCKDGRVWGQNNSYNMLKYKQKMSILKGGTGIIGEKAKYEKKGWNSNSAHKGIPLSENLKNKIQIAHFGKKQTEETKEKIRKKLKGVFKGEKCPSWRGGITPLLQQIRHCDEYKQWRKSVFERDHYRCLICGEVGGELNAHHIKKFSKILEENGITMCRDCHYLTKSFDKRLKKEVV